MGKQIYLTDKQLEIAKDTFTSEEIRAYDNDNVEKGEEIQEIIQKLY